MGVGVGGEWREETVRKVLGCLFLSGQQELSQPQIPAAWSFLGGQVEGLLVDSHGWGENVFHQKTLVYVFTRSFTQCLHHPLGVVFCVRSDVQGWERELWPLECLEHTRAMVPRKAVGVGGQRG